MVSNSFAEKSRTAPRRGALEAIACKAAQKSAASDPARLPASDFLGGSQRTGAKVLRRGLLHANMRHGPRTRGPKITIDAVSEFRFFS